MAKGIKVNKDSTSRMRSGDVLYRCTICGKLISENQWTGDVHNGCVLESRKEEVNVEK